MRIPGSSSRALPLAALALALVAVGVSLVVLGGRGQDGGRTEAPAGMVDDIPLSDSALNATLVAFGADASDLPADVRVAALDDLGAVTVLARVADERGLEVRAELIDEQVDLLARRCCGGDRNELGRWLAERGTDTASLRAVTADRLAADQLRASFVTKARPSIGEAALRRAYAARRGQLATPAQREVIIVRVPDQQAAIAAAGALVEEDAVPEEVARALSSDPSAPGGGRVTVRRPSSASDPDPALTRAAFSLVTGAVSQPFASRVSGWLVVMARGDVQPPRTPTFAEARDELSEQLAAEAGERAWAAYLGRLARAGRFEGVGAPSPSGRVFGSPPVSPSAPDAPVPSPGAAPGPAPALEAEAPDPG